MNANYGTKAKPKYWSVDQVLSEMDQLTELDEEGNRKSLFFAGFIYAKFNNQTRKIEFLVLNYRKEGTGPLQIKFPGGCSELGETALDACINEATSEIGFRPAKQSLCLIHNHQICDKITGNPVHIKTFFVSTKLGAAIKTKSSSDKGEAGPVYFMDAETLAKKIFPSHKEALYKACKELRSKNREYGWCLQPVINMMEIDFK